MKKKIIIMYDFFSEHGGIERIMLFQARALKKAGYDVSFAFAYYDKSFGKERLKGFPVIEYSKLPFRNETLQISLSIIKNCSIEKFKNANLIICHSFPASYLALRIKKKFKIPYILHLHHPPQFLYTADLSWAKSTFKRKFSFTLGKILRFPLRKFDSYCVKNADFYFAESKAVRKLIKEVYNIDSQVLYPTIDKKFKISKSSLKELSKYNINKSYILGSGRVIRQKRFDYLIEAFAKLNLKDKFKIVIAGKYDESEKKYLEELASKYKININFLGPLPIEELVKIYNLAKLTVLTCPKEWFGIVPIEAMACGCPVVAWKDSWGPEESIIPNKGGFLAKPYSTSDLAENIKKTLNKNWNKKEIAKSIRKFSEEEQSKTLLSSVSKVLSSHS